MAYNNIGSYVRRAIIALPRVKPLLDVTGLIVLIIGLYYANDQARQFNRSQNLSNWSDVTARTLEVDHVLIDHPDFQKYFYEGADIAKTDSNYQQAYSIAVMELDFFDSVTTRLKYNNTNDREA